MIASFMSSYRYKNVFNMFLNFTLCLSARKFQNPDAFSAFCCKCGIHRFVCLHCRKGTNLICNDDENI